MFASLAGRSLAPSRLVTVYCSVLLLLAVLFTGLANAGTPAVEFDVVSTVAVRHITSSEFPAPDVHSKLIAMSLVVSTYVSPLRQPDVSDIVITLDNPSEGFQVVDFFPKTTLDSPLAGPVSVKTSDQRRLGIDFDATGIYKQLTGATLTGKFVDAHDRSTEFQVRPPPEVVAASGTIQRGHGVYFKLRPSPTESIEGAKEFLIVARVPHLWRGDIARVRCTAGGVVQEGLLSLGETERLAQRDFLVGLYLEGDTAARRLAEQFVASEQGLRRAAAEQRKQIQRQGSPKLLQKIGFATPSSSSKWLDDWLYGQANREIIERMPSPVRKTALQYSSARAELHALNGE